MSNVELNQRELTILILALEAERVRVSKMEHPSAQSNLCEIANLRMKLSGFYGRPGIKSTMASQARSFAR
jgi:hypothetical protein